MKSIMKQLVFMFMAASIVWAGPYSGSYVDENHPEGTIDEGVPGFVGPAGTGVTYKENNDGSSNGNFVNPVFKQWGAEIIDYSPAPGVDENWKNADHVLGPVTGINEDISSLGELDEEQINNNANPGEITIRFDYPIVNDEGHDLVIFENGFSSNSTEKFFAELAFVEVSSDGTQFARFPSDYSAASDLVSGYGYIDPTFIYNLAGKHANSYGKSWGTPFDLASLEDDPLVSEGHVDLNNIHFVRIVDIPGNGSFKDAKDQSIFDAWPTHGAGGVDLEAIGVINSQSGADFEDLELNPDSYWAGQFGPTNTRSRSQVDVRSLFRSKQKLDEIQTFFKSNVMNFPNNFTDWGGGSTSWNGFAYSNMKDTETPGLINQYSAFTGEGVNMSSNYGIAFIPMDYAGGTNKPVPQQISFDTLMPISGMYITNTTYSMLAMLNGNSYAKKFGGESGDDQDYYKVIITGIDANAAHTEPVEFYLADFRFEDNRKDYIINKWTWIDLSHLGELYGLELSIDSSDKGSYGINTPAYFALDNINGTPPYTGRIAGYVKSNMDNYINPIARATVYLKGTSLITESDENGHFCFKNIPVGNYTIEVVANHFNDHSIDVHTDVSTIVSMNPLCDIHFEDLPLEPESYWNGGSQSRSSNSPEMIYQMARQRKAIKDEPQSSFQSGYARLEYSNSDGYWSGFAYSNMTDTETPGYENQYSAIPGKGVHGSSNYAIAYIPSDWGSGTYDPIPKAITFDTDDGIILSGMYVTNTTYAYLAMKNGGGVSSIFGGASGDAPDFFKLIITGYDINNNETGVIEFYLADFRFEDNSEDYIVDTWEWVDLSSLGAVKMLKCSVDSSDKGDYGINTPMYFAIDNINQITLGSVEGIVNTDITGQIVNVKDAVVSIVGTNISTHTDQYGHFQIDNMIAGDYELVISSGNFSPISIDVSVSNFAYEIIPEEMTILSAPATQCKWDINQNGKIDLAEIIHYLQILSRFEGVGGVGVKP